MDLNLRNLTRASLPSTLPEKTSTGKEGALRLCLSRVTQNDPGFSVLDLSSVPLDMPENATTLFYALAWNTHVKELRLDGTGMGEAGLRLLADILCKNELTQEPAAHLEALYLSGIDIGADAISEFAWALHLVSGLRTLVLSRNPIKCPGAEYLGNWLSLDSCLTELDLARCKIADRGACALVCSLGRNATLTRLDLSGNCLGERAAQAFARALTTGRCGALRELNLEFNYLGDAGGIALAEALRCNCQLRQLRLGGCNLSDSAAQALAEAVCLNQSLCLLDLSLNRIGSAGIQALGKAREVRSGDCTIHGLDQQYV
ncbi:hypothetical protein FNU76_15050 [Chitinimonas arctica]|uniref:Uncharacterized protein n=1 Tax=Chitinimonas arctica TaxID=2594795 RepID=A0A516SHC2_9NEIS|nr:hypothetical protein [Chitinimonas arctica]QDQ27564.1 hypothetical protein FNU76_15050 [Chitinimonas arctica]